MSYDVSDKLRYAFRNGQVKNISRVWKPENSIADIEIRAVKKTGGQRLPTKTRKDFLFKMYAEILQAVGIGTPITLLELPLIFSKELHQMYKDLKQTEKPNVYPNMFGQKEYKRPFTKYKDRFYRLLYGMKQLGMIELTEDPESKQIFITPLRELRELQNVASDDAFYDVTSAVF